MNQSEKFDIAFIGHFARDEIVVGDRVQVASGGSVYYGAIAVARLGYRVAVVTRLHPDDFPRLEELKQAGIAVFAGPAPATSGIRNIYDTPDMDRRRCRLLGFAGPFSWGEIPPIEARVWLIGPIIAGEIDLPLLKRLAEDGRTIALDVQGFIRVPHADDLVTVDWPDKEIGLRLVHTPKVDMAEAEALTGERDASSAMRALARYGPKEVLLTHARGAMVLAHGRIYEYRYQARSLDGRTGRGDTCFATYVARRLTDEPEAALRFAVAATSLKLEQPGPLLRTEEEIWSLARQLTSIHPS